jgi:hypothetical protein
MPLRCSDIRTSFERVPVETTVSALFRHGESLLPFWQLAVRVWADRLGTPADKLAAHQATIEHAFQWMTDWRTKRAKLVRKNENAVSSAISYLRNGAHRDEVRDLLISPVARNAAGCLRMCLHLSKFNYEDSQVPTIVACEIFALAAVRTVFPIDLSNLVHYAPDSIQAEGGDIDNYNAMLAIGSRDLGLESELDGLNAEAEGLFAEFEIPRPLDLPATMAVQLGGERNARLYFDALRAFHRSH